MAKTIQLSGGEEVLVDDEDFPVLVRFDWRIAPEHNSPITDLTIARTKKTGGILRLRMHQIIMGGATSVLLKDGNPLNMQKDNIEVVSYSVGMHGRDKRRGTTSKYKGVYWNKARKKFLARVNKKGEKLAWGYFDTQEEAASLYNEKALELYGEHATINVIPRRGSE